jgi:hypothetical protein
MQEALAILFSVALASFLIRWGVNWVLLNRINNTDFFSFKRLYSFEHFFPLLKHIAVSEWKLWWKGPDHSYLKKISNILSVMLYSCVTALVMIINFVI